MLFSDNEARALLGPLHQPLDAALRGGWQFFNENIRGLRPSFCPRARNATVNGEARRLFQNAVAELDGVVLYEEHNTIIAGVKDEENVVRAHVRLKKLDAKLRTSNYPTKRARGLEDQRSPDMLPPAPIIVAGYLLDELETQIIETHVVYAKGRRVLWSYRLDHEIAGIVVQIPMFEEPVRRVVGRILPQAPANDTGEGSE